LSSIIEAFPHIASYPISLIEGSIPTDNKTESFIIGFGSLGFGACFLAQSGLVQCLQNRIWSNQTEEQSNINWTMAGVGALLTIYGATNLLIGSRENASPSMSNFASVSTERHLQTCEDKLAVGIESLLQCPQARQIWKKIPWAVQIQCTSSKEVPWASLKDTTIYIAEKNNRVPQSVFFELMNLGNRKVYSKIWKNKCTFTSDTYAKKIEFLEYQIVQATHSIAQKCIEKGYWPEDYDYFKDELEGRGILGWIFGGLWNTEESYLFLQDVSGHTNFYREDWKRECAPVGYDRRQPAE